MAAQCMLRLTLPCAQGAQVAQVELRPSSGRAQVKAAAAHVQTLKRNQRKKKLSLTYMENCKGDFEQRIEVSCFMATKTPDTLIGA
jgi:hypothetical protein